MLLLLLPMPPAALLPPVYVIGLRQGITEEACEMTTALLDMSLSREAGRPGAKNTKGLQQRCQFRVTTRIFTIHKIEREMSRFQNQKPRPSTWPNRR